MTLPAVSDGPGTRARRVLLQARCEQQREELGTCVAAIESRLHGADAALGSMRSVFSKPSVLAGAAALLFLIARRTGWWQLLSRGALLFTTGRQLYKAFRHK